MSERDVSPKEEAGTDARKPVAMAIRNGLQVFVVDDEVATFGPEDVERAAGTDDIGTC